MFRTFRARIETEVESQELKRGDVFLVNPANSSTEGVICNISREAFSFSKEEIIFSYLQNAKRLKIIRPNKVLNVVDNFNAALEAADGEYLAFIGDDDIVTSKILDVANWAKEKPPSIARRVVGIVHSGRLLLLYPPD